MLLKTHLTIAILAIILLLPYIDNPLIFTLAVLISTALPDLDTKKSSWGRHLIFRPFQFFIKHRGIIHSIPFLILVYIILYLTYQPASFGFLIGFSIHLLCDAFTKKGIKPFWPLNLKIRGPLKTGGFFEEIILITTILAIALILLLRYVF